jgi:hypothetical protein
MENEMIWLPFFSKDAEFEVEEEEEEGVSEPRTTLRNLSAPFKRPLIQPSPLLDGAHFSSPPGFISCTPHVILHWYERRRRDKA